MSVQSVVLRRAAAVWLAVELMAGGTLGAQRPGDDLLGVWGTEALMGPQLRGEIILERNSARWTARIAGREAAALQTGDSIVVVFPGDMGVLRAWVRQASLEAFWVQPSRNRAAYATPVRLTRAGADAWRGVVHPIDDRFSLYLAISRDTGALLRGVIRNPEMNWTGGARRYRVEREGEAIALYDPTTGRKRFAQPYDSAQRTITFDFGALLTLKPRSLDESLGFVARAANTDTGYRAPIARGDGWTVDRARSVGLDEGALAAAVARIAKGDPLGDSMPRIHALVVARHGRLVLDEYFYGYTAERPHDLRSASKTMMSVMAGAAMRGGARLDMTTRLAGTDITLGQLLTHTSGRACDDADDKSPGNEDTMQGQRAEKDWYAYFRALPQRHPAGTVYAYCSAGINAVGQAIGQATGTWLPRFFDARIARSLDISRYGINLMPTGEMYGGGGMHMLPRDLLKLGQLYLSGGTWNGTRVVDSAWVRRSTSPQQDVPGGSRDGYAWHLHDLNVGGRVYRSYEASGNGGQFVIVVPDLDVAVAVTAGNYGQYSVWRRIRDVIVTGLLADAVVARR